MVLNYILVGCPWLLTGSPSEDAMLSSTVRNTNRRWQGSALNSLEIKKLRDVASSDVGISARTAIAESTSCQGDLRTCTQPAPLKNKIFKSRSPGSAIFYICHKVFRQKTQLLFHLRKENALIKSFVKKAGTSFCLLLHRSYDCAILNTDIYSIDRGLTDLSKRQGPICHEKKLTSILKLVYQKADTY